MENQRDLFEHGEIELKGQFLLGSNYTFLVEVAYQGEVLPAVYKPMRGEQPLWDFPEASLAGREVAAYLVSEALGFGFVPFTVLREGPFGPGSLQQFIKYDPNYQYFSFQPEDRQRLRPVALFDLLVNNADRKGSHLLVQEGTRRLYVIDHGLCFHEEEKLRTVIWDFAGEPVPDEIIAALVDLRTKLACNPDLPAALGGILNPGELAALGSRLEALVANPVYPQPPEDRRAYPFPPV
ncbi:MAG: SCO1664 family protein [Anaerolineales bacterium]|nr:SCO1664 family protein [Anaerolineales bacterium]